MPDAAAESSGRRLWRHLREAGVGAVVGSILPGVPVVPVADPAVAALLARAHERIRHSLAARSADGALEFGDVPPRPRVVSGPAELRAAVAGAVADVAAGVGCRLELAFDLTGPAGPLECLALPSAGDAVPDVDSWRERLDAARNPVVLAGPGVVNARAVPSLHAFATAGGLGVLNTWGAKGVFPWQSAHHWATVGLQRDDFRLGGLADTDLIVAVGVDPDESPGHRWRLAENIEVPPAALGELARRWRASGGVAEMPPLRERLAAVTQRGWELSSGPLPPSRVTRTYGTVVASRGGLVAADAGTAGYWVARTLGTTLLDSVVVPARAEGEGFAVAAALAARLAAPARPVLAVTDAPLGPHGRALLALGERLGLPVPVEVWDADGPRLDAEAHAARLAEAVYGDGPAVLPLATDPHQLAEMLEAAGPVVAWTWRHESARRTAATVR